MKLVYVYNHLVSRLMISYGILRGSMTVIDIEVKSNFSAKEGDGHVVRTLFQYLKTFILCDNS